MTAGKDEHWYTIIQPNFKDRHMITNSLNQFYQCTMAINLQYRKIQFFLQARSYLFLVNSTDEIFKFQNMAASGRV